MSDVFKEKLRKVAQPRAVEDVERKEFLQQFQSTAVELLQDIVNVAFEYNALTENDIYEWAKLLQEELKKTFPSKKICLCKTRFNERLSI